MSPRVTVLEVLFAVALVMVALVIDPGPAVLAIGAVVVLVVAALALLVRRLLARRRRSRRVPRRPGAGPGPGRRPVLDQTRRPASRPRVGRR